MWWGLALGLVLGEALRCLGAYLWDRHWAYSGKGRTGRQVSYW